MIRSILYLILLTFSYSSYALDYQQGLINLTQFSWVIDGNNLKITSAAANVSSYPGSTFCGYDYHDGKPAYFDICGVAIYLQPGSLYLLSSSSGAGFTAQSAVSAINSLANKSFPLSAFGVSSVTNSSRACLYMYRKSKYEDTREYMPGVCSGGGIAPQPATVKCVSDINNNAIDFGNISAARFVDAGAGNIPEGVRPQTRNVEIKCENAAQGTKLKVLLKANKPQGNILISDNPDVGFIINNSSGQKLVPNNTGSSISAPLDSNHSASIAVNAAPVSVTGKKPVAGPFTATATLEIISD
ncbi:fimbrial protein [Raoultella planticola]|uniref:fimbrial protein n=1 Tax=Raoultella planticola TaxID=575 RepID=UPI0009B8FA8E|nr:fimbrial protein [Raoultella planticola]